MLKEKLDGLKRYPANPLEDQEHDECANKTRRGLFYGLFVVTLYFCMIRIFFVFS